MNQRERIGEFDAKLVMAQSGLMQCSKIRYSVALRHHIARRSRAT